MEGSVSQELGRPVPVEPAARRREAQPATSVGADFDNLLRVDNPAELPYAVRAAAKFVERNLDQITADEARDIQAKLRAAGQGQPEILSVINALEAKSPRGEVEKTPEASAEAAAAPAATEAPALSAETQQKVAELDHMIDVLDTFLDEIDAEKTGALLAAAGKLPEWNRRITDLPAELLTHKFVKAVTARLNRLNAQVQLGQMKANPRFRN